MLREVVSALSATGRMIAHGVPIYVVLEPVDIRLSHGRLDGIVRERMQAEPPPRAER